MKYLKILLYSSLLLCLITTMFGGIVQAQSVEQPFTDDETENPGENSQEEEEEESYNVIKDMGDGIQIVDTRQEGQYKYVTVRSENTEILKKNYIVGPYFSKIDPVTIRGDNQTTVIRFDTEKYPTIEGIVLGYEKQEGVYTSYVVEDVNRAGNIFPETLSGLVGWGVGLSFGIIGVLAIALKRYRKWKNTEKVIFNYD